MAILAKNAYFDPPGGQKWVKMNFWEKSENVMFLHSLRLSFMRKISKIYRAVLRENLVRQRERQTDRDGPEYKGPPDAIAKPSDQKRGCYEKLIFTWEHSDPRKFMLSESNFVYI